jgi:hypothetical protein
LATPINPTINLSVEPGEAQHTLDLAAIAASNTEWMLATRLVATDLIQAFGVPEVLQISATGALRNFYWGADHARYAAWAEATGIEVDPNSVSWL